MAQLTFRRLKARTNATSHDARKRLTLPFRTPSDLNLVSISVPERMVSELLARNLLEGHDNVEPVMSGKHFLVVKRESLDLPVFHEVYGYERFMAKPFVKDYLQRRELMFGVPPIHTFCSFRAMTASILEQSIGEADTQKVLAHAVGSSTFRRHYDVGCNHIDLIGILLEEGNRLEQGTAREPNVVSRGDFEVAKRNLGIANVVSKDKMSVFVDEYQRQAEVLDQVSVDERKKNLGKCTLIPWLQEHSGRHDWGASYIFIREMRTTPAQENVTCTVDEMLSMLGVQGVQDMSDPGQLHATSNASQGEITSTAHDMCNALARLNSKNYKDQSSDRVPLRCKRPSDEMETPYQPAEGLITIPPAKGRTKKDQKAKILDRLDELLKPEHSKYVIDEDVEEMLRAPDRKGCSLVFSRMRRRKPLTEGHPVLDPEKQRENNEQRLAYAEKMSHGAFFTDQDEKDVRHAQDYKACSWVIERNYTVKLTENEETSIREATSEVYLRRLKKRAQDRIARVEIKETGRRTGQRRQTRSGERDPGGGGRKQVGGEARECIAPQDDTGLSCCALLQAVVVL
ncbi:hypothetical protein M409DRAFT_59713 [Zasmidium cellare ATCC 36951]|uniref:Uncharacterized protein n=1 Tax=Zasmidium cellare ATCC 36951 TaxID=1080233 RepID=A0A6A6C5L4_ZASCE|nr:uncharacterized protein M409DRAFT_59713 [Zasmidium cellare ATCC 36951]KAF2160676.1 hypothetical protein M409DRAFT_59713 [Zasmidium cellare ATCC 36951]